MPMVPQGGIGQTHGVCHFSFNFQILVNVFHSGAKISIQTPPPKYQKAIKLISVQVTSKLLYLTPAGEKAIYLLIVQRRKVVYIT